MTKEGLVTKAGMSMLDPIIAHKNLIIDTLAHTQSTRATTVESQDREELGLSFHEQSMTSNRIGKRRLYILDHLAIHYQEVCFALAMHTSS